MLRSILTKTVVTAALALSLVFPGASAIQAQGDVGVPGGPFATEFRVQNLGEQIAKCSYVLYRANGTQAYTSALPDIAPDNNTYIYTPSVAGIPAGETLAGVVSCDQPVAAVVNYSEPNSGDSFVGVSTPNSTLYVPAIYNNYYNFYTSLRIMDASGAANTGKVEYFDGATKVGEDTLNLAANGSVTLMQSSKAFLLNNKVYSAKITGSGPLASIVQIYGGTGTTVASQLYAFSAFSGGATKVFVPVVFSGYYGYNTATTVQNAGTAAASVRVTYSNGTIRNFNLAPGASEGLVDYQILPASNAVYSAVVENTGTTPQPLIVTVNESNNFKNATTYEGVPSGGRTLVAPSVMSDYYGYSSSISCQNVSTASTPVRVSYKGINVNAGNAAVSVPAVQKFTLNPGASSDVVQLFETSLPRGFAGSATITADQNIVCVVNQSIVENAPQTKDQLFAYNAIVKN